MKSKPVDIIYLNGMHQELWGISDVIHVVDAMNLVFLFRRHCTRCVHQLLWLSRFLDSFDT